MEQNKFVKFLKQKSPARFIDICEAVELLCDEDDRHKERDAFYERYLKKMRVSISADGDLKLVLGE